MFQRCYVCRGQKKVAGLGCIIKKCRECAGTGFIEIEQDVVETKTKRKSHWAKDK